MIPTGLIQACEQGIDHVEPQRFVIVRVLELRVNPYRSSGFGACRFRNCNDFVKGENRVLVVHRHIVWAQFRSALSGFQCLKLFERKVFSEPAFKHFVIDCFGGFSVRKFGPLCYIGGRADFVFMTGD